MKRFVAIVVFLALVAGAAYWVQTRHNGQLAAALADVKGRALSLVGRTPEAGQTASAERPNRGREGGPATAVLSALAQTRDLAITRTSVGWVEPIATVAVRPRIDGQILEQRVRDGQTVKQGDVLFRLDDREIQAQIARDQATLARDQATLAKAQADLKRAQELLSRNVGSPVQVEQFTADVKVASANVAADEAALAADRIRLGYTTITAPIAGRVGTVRITEGNLVRASDTSGDGLVTITQMQPLRVTFALPERDLDLLRAAMGRRESAPVRALPSGQDEAVATGALTFVDSTVDQASGTITAKATFPNEDGGLWPGQYVRVEIELGMRRNTVTVPLVAVQPGQDGSYVYVVRPDKTAERRKVELAGTFGELAAIGSGVEAGEHVVVEGQLRLRNGSRVADTLSESTPPARGAASVRTSRAGPEAEVPDAVAGTGRAPRPARNQVPASEARQ